MVVIEPFRTDAMDRRRSNSVVLTKFVLSVRNVHTRTPVIITSAAADPDSQIVTYLTTASRPVYDGLIDMGSGGTRADQTSENEKCNQGRPHPLLRQVEDHAS